CRHAYLLGRSGGTWLRRHLLTARRLPRPRLRSSTWRARPGRRVARGAGRSHGVCPLSRPPTPAFDSLRERRVAFGGTRRLRSSFGGIPISAARVSEAVRGSGPRPSAAELVRESIIPRIAGTRQALRGAALWGAGVGSVPRRRGRGAVILDGVGEAPHNATLSPGSLSNLRVLKPKGAHGRSCSHRPDARARRERPASHRVHDAYLVGSGPGPAHGDRPACEPAAGHRWSGRRPGLADRAARIGLRAVRTAGGYGAVVPHGVPGVVRRAQPVRFRARPRPASGQHHAGADAAGRARAIGPDR